LAGDLIFDGFLKVACYLPRIAAHPEPINLTPLSKTPQNKIRAKKYFV
jgi:hypothetical protein